MSSLLSPKKLILFGFIVILLIAIPLTVYLVQKQQEIRGKAAPSTILSFVPESTAIQVGQTVSFDLMVDPGSNQVSFVKLGIIYDPAKLKVTTNGFVPNAIAFPTILQEPVYESGSISATLSVGADPTKVIQAITKIATVTFEALEQTDAGIPTRITFDSQTQVLSIASGDVFNENVLSTTKPASVAITAGTISPTPTLIPSVSPTATPRVTLTPTPTPTGVPTPTPTTVVVQPTNQTPSCTALTLDQAATGTAPYTLTFTAVGTDSDGTVSKVTFSFGDGITQDETQTGGIGTNSVNVSASHTYSNAGTFTATATITDNEGAVSDTTSCTQTITVNSAIAVVPTTPPAPPPVAATQIPTVPPTGPAETILGIGAIGIILIIIGGALLLIL
ncbi:MAG: PKD domain-containing protein [Candidatus Levybacteria bacterium]|nr:PKD domain-containing protein [Candidatus Levybacteria bacterium]